VNTQRREHNTDEANIPDIPD